jgi:cystathionine beta-lyase/cystathionine gamma-synthase
MSQTSLTERACTVANALRAHPAVPRLWYPGLDDSPDHAVARAVLRSGLYGPMLSFELAGGLAAAVRFSRRIKVTRVISSFGGTRTALCHPGSTSHRQLSHAERARAGMTEGMLRLAVGLEDAEDLRNDLLSAVDG